MDLTSKRHRRQHAYLLEIHPEVTSGGRHDDAQTEDVDAHRDDDHETREEETDVIFAMT